MALADGIHLNVVPTGSVAFSTVNLAFWKKKCILQDVHWIISNQSSWA